ncbi:alpha/beta fold hydrolase [Oxalobacter sp. OttesenSCG-928-P03]|nr:alpha/beta fold hydrolase [Oxalobacter sp. OttesenSCG-928-P03]
MILYLHGFRSSPLSFKAQAAADYMAQHGLSGHFFCPQLPESPYASVVLAIQLMEGYDPNHVLLIGSSLGGYYATFLAERTGCKAVLLNPVVDPWDVKAKSDNPPEGLELAEWEKDREKYAFELRQFQVLRITRPERYFLIAATGDELLDYRQMSRHYSGARQIIIEGSDHSLSEFPDYLDEILAFSGLSKD